MPKKSSKKSASKKSLSKVVSINNKEDAIDEKQTILQQAAAAVKNEDYESAEKFYKQQLEQKAFNAAVYSKLMIVYRKQKKYKEELQLITKGLEHFKEHTQKQQASKHSNAAIKKLSSSLNKSLGLTDKKGNFVFEPAPVPAWKKRKATVEKRLKKK